MDYRKALGPGEVLDFPGMICTLEEEIGRGSNAVVYRGWYPDLLNGNQRHIVLIKELFPFHAKQGIYRGARGEIIREEAGRETWEIHKKSFEYGNAAHLKLLERYPDQIGANINTFALNDTHYTVLGYTGGRSMEQEFYGPAGNLRNLCRLMIGILDALEAFHESGLLHLDIAPDNILLIGRPMKERVMLIDYNSVFDMNSFAAPAHFSVKAGYTAPEVCKRDLVSIGEASDLYSVTAVFFRCLTGRALTASEIIRPVPPDVSGCECLKNQPDTVRTMVHAILFRGLKNLPRLRFGAVQEMREAFQELIDRIDGVGITHWALWEAGRKTVDRMIRENPAYAFIRKETGLLPVNAQCGDKLISADECIGGITAETGGSVLLTAPGGMGKTTAMLRAMRRQNAVYTPSRGAMAYVSLRGWKDGQTAFIRNRILETLHFKPETHSYEDAKHVLMQLLEAPIRTRGGDRPVLVILLDGLNEASGDTQALNEEIRELSSKAGVRLVVSTRSEETGLPFDRVRLSELTEEDVRQALAEDGLLTPESPQMQALLKTPLMLSIFREASAAEDKQLSVETMDDLMAAYISSLIRKELADLPDESDARWQIEAAVRYVLPAMAAEIGKRKGAAKDADLLAEAEKCFRLFSTGILRSAFPEWIGHSGAIRGSAKNAEEWYGQIVHGLLWKRMGLLIRTNGGYQTAHQIIEEYLIRLDRINRQKIAGKRRLLNTLIAAVLAVVVAAAAAGFRQWIRPQPYDAVLADTVLNYGLMGYQQAGNQYENVRNLMDCLLKTPENYDRARQMYDSNAGFLALTGSSSDDADAWAKDMFATGKVMPGSGKAMAQAEYSDLIRLYEEREAEYAGYLDVVDYLMNNETAYRKYAESYFNLLDRLIERDADIAAMLYQIVCMQHAEEMYEYGSAEAKAFESVFSSNSRMKTHLNGETDVGQLRKALSQAQADREALRNEIQSHAAAGQFDWKEG